MQAVDIDELMQEIPLNEDDLKVLITVYDNKNDFRRRLARRYGWFFSRAM